MSKGGKKTAKKYGLKYMRNLARLAGIKSGEARRARAMACVGVKADIKRKNILEIKSGGRDRFREIIRIRDKHTCQICLRVWKKGERRFDVHHEDEEQEGRSKERGICKRDKENMDKMITLCHKCHLSLDSVKAKMRKERLTKGL